MTSGTGLRRWPLIFAVCAMAACSQGGASTRPTEVASPTASLMPSTTVLPSTTAAPPSTRAPSTTSTEATNPATTTTPTARPQPQAMQPLLAPLTNLPVDDAAVLEQPSFIVKIDNHPDARPQVGLDEADIVIEERVEAGLTRFFAVYHSQLPPFAGPVRSARTQDVLLLPMFGTPLFGWSGGNFVVREEIADAPVIDASAGRRGFEFEWYRDDERPSPHNLMVKVPGIIEAAPERATPPPAVFTFAEPASTPGGQAVDRAKVRIGDTRVEWRWQVRSGRWVRWQNGGSHRVASGAQIQADNIVLLEVRYPASAADANSPEAQTLGTGKVTVLVGGHAIEGTWRRDEATEPWTLLDADGNVIELAPGQTWVELVPRGKVALVPHGVDPESVDFPQR